MTIDNIALSKIITRHPGGYLDIIETLQRHASDQVKYSKIRYLAAPAGQKSEKVTDELVITCEEILAEIEKHIDEVAVSGLIGGTIQNTLQHYGLPTPNDSKRWLMPAEMWFA